ncbi:MAG: hypothetical protein M3131_07975 [Actinomycetota bacterium]|nr:hypothetical protein [Actinomycetota bacterium]
MTSGRVSSTMLAVVWSLALAPSGADAARPVPGATYVGSIAGKGYVELPVARDGRRIFDLSGLGPADCEDDGEDGGVSLFATEIDVRVGRDGRFKESYEADVGSTFVTIRGRFLSNGRVRGGVSYFDRTCRGKGRFSAKAVRRGPGLRTPVFPALFAGVPAREAGPALRGATAFDVYPDGSFLVAYGGAVRRVDLDGRMHTLLRRGPNLGVPADVAILPGGGFLVAGDNCVRRVDAAGAVTVVAGRCDPDGDGGFSGDGGPATAAQLRGPTTIAATPDGGFLFADGPQDPEEEESTRVRRVSASGVITTVAGVGRAGFSGDGGTATRARLGHVADLSVEPGGGFLIADSVNSRVRRVAPDGRITTVAGDGDSSFSGDRGRATRVSLAGPTGVARLPDGGFLVSDSANTRIRRVSAGGSMLTLAGGDEGGTGAPAGRARLAEPGHIRLLPGGGFAVLDDSGISVIASPQPRLLIGLPLRAAAYRARLRRGRPIPVRTSGRGLLSVQMRTRRGYRQVLRRRVRAGSTLLRLPRKAVGRRLRYELTDGRRIAVELR